LKLWHLIFAENLILFCKAEEKSIKVLSEGLEVLAFESGLYVNKENSHVIIGVKDKTYKETLIQLIGFADGGLPLRYLGVPISSTRLTKLYSQQLVDKITTEIRMSGSGHFSYAGRVTQINSVLMGLISFGAEYSYCESWLSK